MKQAPKLKVWQIALISALVGLWAGFYFTMLYIGFILGAS